MQDLEEDVEGDPSGAVAAAAAATAVKAMAVVEAAVTVREWRVDGVVSAAMVGFSDNGDGEEVIGGRGGLPLEILVEGEEGEMAAVVDGVVEVSN